MQSCVARFPFLVTPTLRFVTIARNVSIHLNSEGHLGHGGTTNIGGHVHAFER